jgi:uncharacterized protein YqeY
MLTEQITVDLKDAMKAQDAARLSTLRLLKAALKNRQIDLMRELTDDEAAAVVKTQIKQLREAIETAEQAGRPETAREGRAEVAVLEKYLPSQLGDEELAAIVREAVAASGATSRADAGKAMGAAMKAAAGRADGSRVKALVEAMLAVLVLAAAAVLAPSPAEAASSSNAEFVVSGARILRVFLMLMGIVSVNFILLGSVSLMTASGRDHGHHHGIQQLVVGIFGTILMAGLIAVASATIVKLE